MSDLDLRKLETEWLDTRDLEIGVRYYKRLARAQAGCPQCRHPETLAYMPSPTLEICARCGCSYTAHSASVKADELEQELRTQQRIEPLPPHEEGVIYQGAVTLMRRVTGGHEGGSSVPVVVGSAATLFTHTIACPVPGCGEQGGYDPHSAAHPEGWIIRSGLAFCPSNHDPARVCVIAGHSLVPSQSSGSQFTCARCAVIIGRNPEDPVVIVCVFPDCTQTYTLYDEPFDAPPGWLREATNDFCPFHSRQAIYCTKAQTSTYAIDSICATCLTQLNSYCEHPDE